MKHKILIAGLFFEFLACLRVPVIISFMHPGYEQRVKAFGDYEWLWVLKSIYKPSSYGNDYVMCDIDIPRLIITMVAIAILTTMLYLIARSKETK